MPSTLRQYDPLGPNAEYPLWDVKRVIEFSRRAGTDSHKGELRLEPLEGYHNSGVAYARFRLSTTRKPGDVDESGIVCANDYRRILDPLGTQGATIADVADWRALGLPDGRVDEWDAWHLYDVLSRAEQGKVPAPVMPYVLEDFEAGYGALWEMDVSD